MTSLSHRTPDQRSAQMPLSESHTELKKDFAWHQIQLQVVLLQGS